MKKTDLSVYTTGSFSPGAGIVKRTLWYFVNIVFFISPVLPLSHLKVTLLRMFGAKVGRGVVIKPAVNIKYPWKLIIGDHTWIGEKAWIDNLNQVSIGSNCCISQGAMLLCGNHNFKKTSFDLITRPIILEEGAWIGAYSVVCPGITCKSHSVLTVNSVATIDMEPYFIYQGNPAVKTKERKIE
ncbi:MAG: WcaF family extracellular polysaccharide biosynthesis acetyltransferase [Lentimicrobium sp.]|jgi:putative colanic acid biosynthesis acetyltransferase WcaF|nr:WcaF family extracellular polysaccharide biosynthesis acetyltransferase [Lentimicrobium sp.]